MNQSVLAGRGTIADVDAVWSIIVHGGAGPIDDRQSEPHQAGCRRAAEAGGRVLAAGGTALDATIAAVHVLEDDPCFNAGIGSTLDEDGVASCDAAVMRGSDLAYGAVGAVSGVRNPIDLARAILEDGKHCFLVGAGAIAFARRSGVRLCDPRLLATEASQARWWRAKAERRGDPAPSGETVGAVARDAAGDVAAATSTGGLLGKYAGRVGDSPVAGAGTYARGEWGAISATGHGETILRSVLGFEALLALSRPPDERGPAAEILRAVLDQARSRIGGRGGLIAVLPDGEIAWARNTAHMGVAWLSEGGPLSSTF